MQDLPVQCRAAPSEIAVRRPAMHGLAKLSKKLKRRMEDVCMLALVISRVAVPHVARSI
jgi:hypothetical protein